MVLSELMGQHGVNRQCLVLLFVFTCSTGGKLSGYFNVLNMDYDGFTLTNRYLLLDLIYILFIRYGFIRNACCR